VIARGEIEEKSREFGIHISNVQRDYVYGWLLSAIYADTALKDVLIFKGGNCFRKAYFPNTRFSSDLDFASEAAIDESLVIGELNRACDAAQQRSGVIFDTGRTQIRVQNEIDDRRRVFDARVYFRDFYGNADHLTLKVSIDITEFERIYLPPQLRNVIHPYSDQATCVGQIRCVKLEEMIASKLKCLLQRRHVPDVYDLVYSVFVNRDIAVDRGELVQTFLRKTIYERAPAVARQLLLDLPLLALRNAWERYIVAPIQGLLEFDDSIERFRTIVGELFAGYEIGRPGDLAFFPSALRNPIMEAGSGLQLLSLDYDNVRRVVEPYSLVYKTRKDGHREEYLYVWDRTGGRTSGPGIKTFFHHKIRNLLVMEERFEPRFPVDMGKAGDVAARSYFNKPFTSSSSSSRRARIATLRHGWRYTVQCGYCSRRFKRMRLTTMLRSHNDGYGNRCPGRRGQIVDQQLV
jgi:predicted nucleotidyltransferase component of viral defense system